MRGGTPDAFPSVCVVNERGLLRVFLLFGLSYPLRHLEHRRGEVQPVGRRVPCSLGREQYRRDIHGPWHVSHHHVRRCLIPHWWDPIPIPHPSNRSSDRYRYRPQRHGSPRSWRETRGNAPRACDEREPRRRRGRDARGKCTRTDGSDYQRRHWVESAPSSKPPGPRNTRKSTCLSCLARRRASYCA